MRYALPLCLLFAACADPVDPDAGLTDAGADDTGVRLDATLTDTGAGDVGFNPDALPNDDAMPGLDVTPTDTGFVMATACGTAVPIETTGENIFKPSLYTRGSEVFFIYTSGLNRPYSTMVAMGDGDTFAPGVVLLGALAEPIRVNQVRVARDGRVAAHGPDQNLTNSARAILDTDHQAVGPRATFNPGGGGCGGALASSATEIFMVHGHQGVVFADGLDWSKASQTTWSATATIGDSGIYSYLCDVAASVAGHGATIAADGQMRKVAIRALRSGEPVGEVYTATIAGTSMSAATVIAKANGDVLAYAVVGTLAGSSLWEIDLIWDELGQRFMPTRPVEVIVDDFNSSYMFAIDHADRITVAYVADAHAWGKRRIAGVWQPSQDFGQQGGFGQDPIVQLDPVGNVAVLYIGPGLEVALRQAEANSATFGPELRIPGTNALNGSGMTWHPNGGLIAAWSVGAAGINNIVAARCQ